MNSYPFRFSLSPGKKNSVSDRRGLDDFFHTQLHALLDLMIPMEKNREVHVDGYKMMNNRQVVNPLYREDTQCFSPPSDPLDLYEPRIGYIRHLLDSLSRIVDLEENGQKVHFDGFRLKDPMQWRSSGNASDILAHAASRCNLDCRFCYNHNARSVLKFKPRLPEDEYEEIKARIDFYEPRSGLNIFPNMGSPAEVLAHPYFFDILSRLRLKTKEPLRFSTNGSLLTGDTICRLAPFMPIHLDLSLNSSSPDRRQWLMNDPQPQIAINALSHLKDEKISYGIVIVPWPEPSVDIMLADLKRTVEFAADFDPTTIQISLPGFVCGSRQRHPFCHDAVWESIKDTVICLRTVVRTPLVLRPGFFEEYLHPEILNTPIIIGCVKHSPADKSGLRNGDIIRKINGIPIKNRRQARSLLTILHQSDLKKAMLLCSRNGSPVDLQLDLTSGDYPYSAAACTHLGMIFPSSGFPQEWIDRLAETIAPHNAADVLLLTSTLVRPTLERYLQGCGIGESTRLHIRVPENSYFGGNIFMGDLMVAADFIDCIRNFIDTENLRPDLVVIPASPFHISGWSRDLTGTVFLEIERRTGIPVALVECDPVFD